MKHIYRLSTFLTVEIVEQTGSVLFTATGCDEDQICIDRREAMQLCTWLCDMGFLPKGSSK
jgi:hypothetical protein